MSGDHKEISRLVATFATGRQTADAHWRVLEPRFLDGLANRLEAYSVGLATGAAEREWEGYEGTTLRALETEAHWLGKFLHTVALQWRDEGSQAVIPTSPQH